MLKSKPAKIVEKLQDFYEKQDVWMRAMISNNANTNPLWNHVGLIVSQFDGLMDGYHSVAPITEV